MDTFGNPIRNSGNEVVIESSGGVGLSLGAGAYGENQSKAVGITFDSTGFGTGGQAPQAGPTPATHDFGLDLSPLPKDSGWMNDTIGPVQ